MQYAYLVCRLLFEGSYCLKPSRLRGDMGRKGESSTKNRGKSASTPVASRPDFHVPAGAKAGPHAGSSSRSPLVCLKDEGSVAVIQIRLAPLGAMANGSTEPRGSSLSTRPARSHHGCAQIRPAGGIPAQSYRARLRTASRLGRYKKGAERVLSRGRFPGGHLLGREDALGQVAPPDARMW